MTNVQVGQRRVARISQGDLFRDIECVEYVKEKRGIIEVSKIAFPLVVVLTQDCDLQWDAEQRSGKMGIQSNQDKTLVSVLVAPLYNAEHVYQGQHLSELGWTMSTINKNRTPGDMLRKNERPRYHYLDFPPSVPVVASIVDFKHYFSVNVSYLETLRRRQFVCRLSELYREDLSQRFAAYLARIGLPDARPPRPSKPSIDAAVENA